MISLTTRLAQAAEDLCRPDPACSELDDRARQLVTSGDVSGALATTKEAFRLKAEPRLILNIGRYHFRLGQCQEALKAYKLYGTMVPNPEPAMSLIYDRYTHEAQDACRTQAAERPIYKKWWFWTVLGTVAAAGIAGGIVGGILGRKDEFSPTMPFPPIANP